MKKRYALVSISVLVFSMSFFSFSSRATAESQNDAQKPLAAVLHLNASDLTEQINNSEDEKEPRSKPLRAFLVPLNEGLKAFFDFASPERRRSDALENRSEYRAVFGFNLPLR
jgi:hypothetical protein